MKRTLHIALLLGFALRITAPPAATQNNNINQEQELERILSEAIIGLERETYDGTAKVATTEKTQFTDSDGKKAEAIIGYGNEGQAVFAALADQQTHNLLDACAEARKVALEKQRKPCDNKLPCTLYIPIDKKKKKGSKKTSQKERGIDTIRMFASKGNNTCLISRINYAGKIRGKGRSPALCAEYVEKLDQQNSRYDEDNKTIKTIINGVEVKLNCNIVQNFKHANKALLHILDENSNHVATKVISNPCFYEQHLETTKPNKATEKAQERETQNSLYKAVCISLAWGTLYTAVDFYLGHPVAQKLINVGGKMSELRKLKTLTAKIVQITQRAADAAINFFT